MVFNERTFSVRVCIEVFLISQTTCPGWWVRGDRGGVRIGVKE